MTAPDLSRSIDAIWRIEFPRLVAGLTRFTGDLSGAEDLAQDALVAALEHWPRTGVPERPGAWLMTTAKRRALDQLRRGKMLDRKHEQLGRELDARPDTRADERDAALDDEYGDDLLRLMFMTCHPVLSSDARVALTLRLLGGLTAEEIARAFLVSVPTVEQRIVRAKRTLAEARVPFEAPRGSERAERLASVLGVLYLVFNEGYAATRGDDWLRPALCEDALRLGRVLAELASEEPEVHGLVALMELTSSRSRARVGPNGEPVLLLDQDRAVQLHDRRRRERRERIVERHDAGPVGLRRDAGARVASGDRGLECVDAARTAERLRPRECREPAVDQERVPAPAVLVQEQHGLAVRAHARARP